MDNNTLKKKEYTLVMRTNFFGYVETESLMDFNPDDKGEEREEFWCRARINGEDLEDANTLGFVFDPIDYVEVLNRGIELGRRGYNMAVISNVIKTPKASNIHKDGAKND